MKSSLNHVYRTIWSEVLNAWVAVSELTKAKGKRSGASVLNAALVADAANSADRGRKAHFEPPASVLAGLLPGMFRRHGNARYYAQRKAHFEALEPRFLLSADILIPPPSNQVQAPPPPALEAPLHITDAAALVASGAATQYAAQDNVPQAADQIKIGAVPLQHDLGGVIATMPTIVHVDTSLAQAGNATDPAPAATTEQGTPVTIDVLARHFDLGGTLLPGSVVITTSQEGMELGADGKSLVVRGVGVWSVNSATGAITFTPDASFLGKPMPISYRVSNHLGAETSSTLWVEVLGNAAHGAGTSANPAPAATVALPSYAGYAQSRPAPGQVVIVDPAVQDYESLVKSLLNYGATKTGPAHDAATGPSTGEAQGTQPLLPAAQLQVSRYGNVEVVVLDARFDGVCQVADILSSYRNLDAVQLLSHGATGVLRLGGSQISGNKLEKYQEQIAAWGRALRPGGDILLYGCDIAGSTEGAAFVRSLARITGADIAASADATGAAEFGGNWALEHAVGEVEAVPLFVPEYGFLMRDIVSTDANEAFTGTAGGDQYFFADGWGTDTVTDSGTSGTDVLDFSAVTQNLFFTLYADGHLTVSDGDNGLAVSGGIERLIGGQGINDFRFEDAATFSGTIVGGIGGNNNLDFSAYTRSIQVDLGAGTAAKTGGGVLLGGFQQMGKLKAGAGDDLLRGSATANKIDGGKGNDLIFGFGGDDTLIGEEGDDFLDGGAGNDHLDGGAGCDTASYAASPQGAEIDLANAEGKDGFGGTDTFAGIENLEGSAGNDILTGDGSANRIDGGAGDDTLTGGDGDDVLAGGAGDDTLSYGSASSAVTVELNKKDGQGAAVAQDTLGAGSDTLNGFENLTGSRFDDHLTGDSSANVISGGEGNDILNGNGGADRFRFGDDWGDDSITGSGAITLDFSEASHNLFFTIRADGTTAVADGENPLTSLGDMPGAALSAPNGISTLAVTPAVGQLIGGKGDDRFALADGALTQGTIDGADGTNILDYSAFQGAISVDLAQGSATGTGGIANIHGVIAGSGDIAFSGSVANGTLSFEESNRAVNFDLSAQAQQTGISQVNFSSVHNLTGSAFDDLLIGNAGDNVIAGGEGDDLLSGGAGSDTYEFAEGWGDDAIFAETGGVADTLDFSAVTSDLTFTLYKDGTVSVTDGVNTLQPVSGMERLIDGQGNDTFVFEDGAAFSGTIGMDNQFLAALGLDIGGGSGSNTLDFSAYTADISVDLGITIPTTDTNLFAHAETRTGQTLIGGLSNMQNAIGGSGNDRIWGNSAANLLDGGAGDDELFGRDGEDTLVGGAGNDLLQGGFDMAQMELLNPATLVAIFGEAIQEAITNGTLDQALAGDQDTASYAGATSAVSVDLSLTSAQETGGAGNDTLQGVQNLVGSGFNDVLRGNLLGNTLSGAAGNDTLYGMQGSDILIGGAGNDLLGGGEYISGSTLLEHDAASYADAASGVSVNLGLGSAQDTLAAGSDTLTGIEELIGSMYDDVMRGDQYDNILHGGEGNDLLEGGAGSDRLDGGAGSDTVTYVHDLGDVSQGGYSVAANLDSGYATDGSAATDILLDAENLIGSTLKDHLVGNSADNIIDGGGGSDLLEGKGGADRYRFVGNWNGVQIVEQASTGSGNKAENETSAVRDILDFSSVNQNLTFTIHNGGAVSVRAAGDASLVGQIANVEKLLGGSKENSFVFGSSATFTGIMDGGAGTLNTLDYSAYGKGATVNLVATDEQTPGKATGTSGVLNIKQVIGTAFDDTLSGDAGANTLIGGSGNDTLSGGDGQDAIYGGDGNDRLDGGAGNDRLLGGAGSDSLLGGIGNDELTGGTGDDTLKGEGGADAALYDDVTDARGVKVNLGLTAQQDTVGSGKDTLADIENVAGSQYDDILTGNDQDNFFSGGTGNDKLYGNGGNDVLAGGLGDDLLSGGEGNNTVSYAEIENQGSLGVTVDLNLRDANGRPVAQNTGGAGSDTLSEISNVIGSQYGDALAGDKFNNLIVGNAGNDTIDGFGGNDTLSGGGGDDIVRGGLGNDITDGGAGNDQLFGQDGNDLLVGGAGDDRVEGGGGANTASFIDAAEGVAVNLNLQGQAQSTTGAGTDTLIGIANLIGSKFDDNLTGDAADNRLDGRGGNDTLGGGAGNDSLLGGTGDDLLLGGSGSDLLAGGDGMDRISYADDPNGVRVDLSTGSARDGHGGSDTLEEVEGVLGSAGDDVLLGDGGDNLLLGGAGNDSISGGEGDDTLAGGAGADILDGGLGADTLSYAYDTGALHGVNVALGGAATDGYGNSDTITNAENLIGSQYADVLAGDAGDNRLTGGAGDDQLSATPVATPWKAAPGRTPWMAVATAIRLPTLTMLPGSR